jgi:hypothetical protein
MANEDRRYRFAPLDRRGVLVGLSGGQLAVLAAGCALAVGVLRSVPSVAGLLLAGSVVAVAGAAACWTVAGRPPGGWLPIVSGWVWRRTAWSGVSRAPVAGIRAGVPATPDPPRVAAGIRIDASPEFPGEPSIGVVRDREQGAVAAVLAVRGRSFSLLDPTEQERRLAAWGAVLAALGRGGSAVHRVQWIERTVPCDTEGLARHLDRAGTSEPGPWRDSYKELIAGAGPSGQRHEILVVISVQPRRAGRALKVFGHGFDAECGLLLRETRLLRGQLRNAELTVDRVLSPGELAGVVGRAVDHTPRTWRRSPWPMATDEAWACYRTDGTWHATYWVAEWPRVDVGPDALGPLLLGPTGRRTVSVVMGPIPPGRAAREAEAARTADIADEQLRQRAGFLTTVRRKREADGVFRREGELADGHSDYRFSGFVTVTGTDRTELDAACTEIEQAAQQAQLELRRLYGQQAEAFTWTLPLGRGLA